MNNCNCNGNCKGKNGIIGCGEYGVVLIRCGIYNLLLVFNNGYWYYC